MEVERSEIFCRTLTGRCPNCGHFGIFKNWFRLRKRCPECDMELEKEESGFYFGTTSIGYVAAIILVIVPVCILVVLDILGMWLGVAIGIVGSIVLCTVLYPIMLCWVIMLYYLVQAEELPTNCRGVTCKLETTPENKSSRVDLSPCVAPSPTLTNALGGHFDKLKISNKPTQLRQSTQKNEPSNT